MTAKSPYREPAGSNQPTRTVGKADLTLIDTDGNVMAEFAIIAKWKPKYQYRWSNEYRESECEIIEDVKTLVWNYMHNANLEGYFEVETAHNKCTLILSHTIRRVNVEFSEIDVGPSQPTLSKTYKFERFIFE